MRRLIPLVLISLFFNCEEVVQVNLDTSEPRLVVDAALNFKAGELHEQIIRLSLTTAFYEENIIAVSQATVRIINVDNGQEYLFLEAENVTGTYVLNFLAEFETNYILQILYQGDLYESSIEQLQHAVPIDMLVQGDNVLFSGDETEVVIHYTDNPSRNDFYLFEFGPQLYFASKDEFYQGNPFSFSYFYENIGPGDEVTVNIMGIDQRHFDFMSVIIEQTDNNGNPFSTTPSTIYGNLHNTTSSEKIPYGYFRLSEIYTKSITIE